MAIIMLYLSYYLSRLYIFNKLLSTTIPLLFKNTNQHRSVSQNLRNNSRNADRICSWFDVQHGDSGRVVNNQYKTK